jgi:hypothetical protein
VEQFGETGQAAGSILGGQSYEIVPRGTISCEVYGLAMIRAKKGQLVVNALENR